MGIEDWKKKVFSWEGKPRKTIKVYEYDTYLGEIAHEELEVDNIFFSPALPFPCYRVKEVVQNTDESQTIKVVEQYLGGLSMKKFLLCVLLLGCGQKAGVKRESAERYCNHGEICTVIDCPEQYLDRCDVAVGKKGDYHRIQVLGCGATTCIALDLGFGN